MRTVNWSSPVNWNDAINRDLLAWWLVVPHWMGGTTWRDLVGRNDGTLILMDPATDWVGPGDRPGGRGALDFDGSDDRVQINASTIFDLDQFLTLMAWIKIDSFDSTAQNIIARTNGSDWDWQFDISGVTDDLQFFADGGATSINVKGNTSLSTGVWTHVAVTRKAGSFAFYLNGLPDGTGSDTDSLQNNTFDVFSGSSSASEFLDGQMDDCRIWNRELNAAEISQVYQDSRVDYRRTLRRLRRRALAVPPPVGVGGALRHPLKPYSHNLMR